VKIWGRARIVSATPELVARLAFPAVPGQRAPRVEHVVLIDVAAWDVNCPQHIPPKIDLADAQRAQTALRSAVSALKRGRTRALRRRRHLRCAAR
jgi:hypothetical protein